MRQLIAGLACCVAWAGLASAGGPGEGLFQEGAGAVAVLMDGQVRAPAGQFSCAGCHGSHAQGRREGGTVFPALSWQAMSDPTRPGGAYDAASFQRAVREGIGADGRTLDRVMPRFEVDEAAMSALVSYLESVQALDRVGISDTAVTLHAGTDPEERAGYAVGADWFNGQGGAFGRKLLLAETGPAAIEQEDLLQRLPGPFAEPDRGDALVAIPPTGLSETGKTAFYRAVVLGEAMIECGANVTRSCLTDVLERVGAAGTP